MSRVNGYRHHLPQQKGEINFYGAYLKKLSAFNSQKASYSKLKILLYKINFMMVWSSRRSILLPLVYGVQV